MTIIVPSAKAGEGAPHSQLCEALDAQTPKGSEWGIGTKQGVPILVEWQYDKTPDPTYYPMPSNVLDWLRIHGEERPDDPVPAIHFEMPEALKP